MSDAALQENVETNPVFVGRIVSISLRMMGRTLINGLPIWLFGAIIFIGTDLVDLIYRSGEPFSRVGVASLIVRLAGPIFIPMAATRLMLQRGPIWALDGRFWRYFGAFLVINLMTFPVAFGPILILRRYLHALPFGPVVRGVVDMVVLLALILLVIFLMLRITMWPTALVIGDRGVGIAGSWRRVRGHTVSYFVATLIMLLPFELVHFGLTFAVQKGDFGQTQRIWIAIADGVVTVPVLLSITAVTVALYKLTGERTGAG